MSLSAILLTTAFVVVTFSSSAVKAVEPGTAAATDAEGFRKLLMGKWTLEQRQGSHWSSQINTYREDGTATSEVCFDMGEGLKRLTLESKWQIEGNKLVYETTKSNDEGRKKPGEKSSDTLIAISAKEYRYLNESGNERVEKRTEADEAKEPPATIGYLTDHIALYQPDEVLVARVPDVTALSGYVQVLEGVCSLYFAATDRPDQIEVVVAVRPGEKSKVWLNSKEVGAAGLESLRKKLEAVTPAEVKEGPVAFAILGKTGGGLPSGEPAEKAPPVPNEWREAMKGAKEPLALPDGVLDLIWVEEK